MGNLDENDMSDKKRTTVTTIETHEVWIIRKAAPELSEQAVTITPAETAQPPVIPAMAPGDTTTPDSQGEETTV